MGRIEKLKRKAINEANVRVLNEQEETTNNLDWDGFKNLMKGGDTPWSGFKESRDKNSLYYRPGTMHNSQACKYKYVDISNEGVVEIIPYKQDCFDKGWSTTVTNFFKGKGNQLETYEYETEGYPPGGNKLTTIKNQGLKTNMEFNQKTKDALMEFIGRGMFIKKS